MAEVEVGVSTAAFATAWEFCEGSRSRPTRVRDVVKVGFGAFRRKIESGTLEVAEKLVDSLYEGDVWVLKNAFPAEWMRELRRKTIAWAKQREQSFHKMLEGSPDFHRIIDLETGKKYSFRCCKHSAYFYRWNDDPLDIWAPITERWRVIKRLMGLAPNEYENFTPKDGVVDRIQIVRYPPAIGYLEPHADPYLHQRLFFSGYMSKRGVDFSGGGFYLVDQHDQVLDIEDRLEVGDACIGYATVMHGVAPCDREKTPDWNSSDGRWFLSMYSNASDEVLNRHTGHPVRLDLPGVLPASL